jgi:hypothetical protein
MTSEETKQRAAENVAIEQALRDGAPAGWKISQCPMTGVLYWEHGSGALVTVALEWEARNEVDIARFPFGNEGEFAAFNVHAERQGDAVQDAAAILEHVRPHLRLALEENRAQARG